MNKRLCPALCALLLVMGCGEGAMRPSEYKKFVENEANGYVQKTQSGTFEIRCLYTPAEYMAVCELHSDDINADQFETLKTDYAQMDNYTLSIQSADGHAFDGLQTYFSFYMQQHLQKVCGTDTTDCVAYHAEPFNAIKGEQYIHFGFPNTNCVSETQMVVLKDTPFLTENIRFSFAKNELTTPEIQTNE